MRVGRTGLQTGYERLGVGDTIVTIFCANTQTELRHFTS
jgi:hypothetical protein